MLDQLDPDDPIRVVIRDRLPEELRPLTEGQRTRLLRLGLDLYDWFVFIGLFVGDLFDFIHRSPTDRDWRLTRRQLPNDLLLDHLAATAWIGTGARRDRSVRPGRFYTWHIAIDLDLGHDQADLLRRYDAVNRALGMPSATFLTPSRGLHLYWLLGEPVALHRVRGPYGDGAVMRLLAAQNVFEQDGRVEVYPRGNYKAVGVQRRIRLPFGRGSRRLDPESLLPMVTGGAMAELRHVQREIAAEQLRFIDAEEQWLTDALVLPAPPIDGRPRSASVTVHPANLEDSDEVARLWREGLDAPNTFHGSVVRLARDLRRRRVPQGEAAVEVHRWLDDHHNGWSRTYNRNRDQAHAEANEVVGRLYARHTARNWGAIPGLTRSELLRLVALTHDDQGVVDPDTGELVSRYRVQRLGFNILRHAKQYVIDYARGCARLVRDSGVPGSALWQTAMLKALQPVWPDSSTGEFVVPIPTALRAKIDGGPEHWARWRAIKHAGIVSLERGSSKQAHRAARYRVLLDFQGVAQGGAVFDLLEVGLSRVLTRSEISALYSRDYAQKVRRATGATALAPVSTDPVVILLGGVGLTTLGHPVTARAA